MMLEGTHADGLGSTGRPHFCRGEHRSPAGFCAAAKLHGRTMFARKNPTLPQNSPGGYRIRPYANMILAPEGSIGEETKSVKKRAALLHVLAFCFFDHIFGVLRGE